MTDASKKIQDFLKENPPQDAAIIQHMTNTLVDQEIISATIKPRKFQGEPDKVIYPGINQVEPQNNSKTQKEDKRHQNKRPPNSGRKPKEETIIAKGVREYIDEHFLGQAGIKIVGPDGKTRVVKKNRAIILIEALFAKGARDQDVSAIREWFDRALGKSAQPIRGDDSNDTPIRLEHDIDKILEKAYGDEND